MQGGQSEANIMAAELQAARQKIRELEEKLAQQKAIIGAQHEDQSFRRSVIERAAEGVCVCHDIPDFPYVEFTVWNLKMIDITGYTMEQVNHNG